MKRYYIQSGWIGNSVCWWAKNSQGYTNDLNKAQDYSEEEANHIVSTNDAGLIAWPVDYVDQVPFKKAIEFLDRTVPYVINPK